MHAIKDLTIRTKIKKSCYFGIKGENVDTSQPTTNNYYNRNAPTYLMRGLVDESGI